MSVFNYVVYQITFPNGKIYIGKDIGSGGHSLRYFGSWSNELIQKDFTKVELTSLTLTKTILYESEDKSQINAKEAELIRKLKSNQLAFGYNQWPKAT